MTTPNLESYTRVIVAFSGGKDSLACVLHLLDLGVPKERLELWHHAVDGMEGSTLMDWPVTEAYCRAVAEALGLPIYFSWKVGGFEGEMGRDNQPTAPTCFEYPTPDGVRRQTVGGKGPAGTRGVFPQVSPDLTVRWCSAYLKIDVCAAAIRNQERFNHTRTLVVTGERAEESPGRARYATLEPHRADARDGRKRRHVDQWRPVHAWGEQRVWETIKAHGVVPHPAYQMGWGRVSCAACIFGSPNQWASLRAAAPGMFSAVAAREQATGKTIQRKRALPVLADAGTPYEGITGERVALAMGHTWPGPVVVDPSSWTLPAGAYGESCGPT